MTDSTEKDQEPAGKSAMPYAEALRDPSLNAFRASDAIQPTPPPTERAHHNGTHQRAVVSLTLTLIVGWKIAKAAELPKATTNLIFTLHL
jgi:hypothetical protein